MKRIKVGTKVRLSEMGRGKYRNSSHNPHNRTGVVLKNDRDTDIGGYFMPYHVDWGNKTNIYYEVEIEPVLEYEDEWELAQKNTPVPENALTAEYEGEVVAFRRKKESEWEFGDRLVNVETGEKGRFICKSIRKDCIRVWQEGRSDIHCQRKLHWKLEE